MTPEERAARAMLDTPYRTPQGRVAREIRDAVDEARTEFRAVLERLAQLAEQASAASADASPACREAIDALARQIQLADAGLR